ncbi:kinesin-like protein KIN-7A [Papaver somniferum]|uniref:kinesin-like protein KIN-7A n=1 Tax=Papaver somniferum TaxID=3469 RepID=UPI000E70394D|nr:kinesin-like protein KIN-7A [Papaver somniferum]
MIEEVVRDNVHLRSLINICVAKRKVGVTFLNDTSSRSHQVIRWCPMYYHFKLAFLVWLQLPSFDGETWKDRIIL